MSLDEIRRVTRALRDGGIEVSFFVDPDLERGAAQKDVDVRMALSVNTATTADVATAMLSGKCALAHEDSTFVGALAAADTTGGSKSNVSPNGDYWAFPLPPFSDTSTAAIRRPRRRSG